MGTKPTFRTYLAGLYKRSGNSMARHAGRMLAMILLLAIVPLARAGQQSEPAGPLKVRVGVYVIDLGKLDTSTGSFTADFYLMFDSDTPFQSFKFEFLNGRSKSFVQQSDDPAYKAYRI